MDVQTLTLVLRHGLWRWTDNYLLRKENGIAMQNKNTKDKLYTGMTISKYVFAFLMILLAFYRVRDARYLLVSVFELVIIGTLSNIILRKKRIPGYVFNMALLWLFNLQMSVLYYGNSYISYLMVSNIDSLAAMSGKATEYIMRVILISVFSFLPVVPLKINKKIEWSLLSAGVAVELAVYILINSTFSPLFGYCSLVIDKINIIRQEREVEKYIESREAVAEKMYKEGIEDYYAKDEMLPENPNIILIFAEGISQNIIDDERNIMPNMAEYQKKSVNFTNYYNHTFATFRGLIGQLYSGFQLEDYDSNPLISVQSILSDRGYDTTFINPEPKHPEFIEYLNNFGFDRVLGSVSDPIRGNADSIADKDLYKMLFETAQAKSEEEKPFFISMYSFGTHASLESIDEKFEDGSNPELNKFYDLDYQFGKFMEKYEKSDFAKDTIIIMTSDHATYEDDSFDETFPDHERQVITVDKIPFFIYYLGIEAKEIDTEGRNSLCLAPTMMDYLDISVPNYFVGTSLFSGEMGSICEKIHSYLTECYVIENDNIKLPKKKLYNRYQKIVQDYYITKEIIANETNK